jgi:Flp pilus assembly protein TadG
MDSELPRREVSITMKHRIFRLREDHGSNIIELALLLPVLLLLLAGAVDFGRGWYVAIEVNSAAHAGALYGSQNPTDISGMTKAAQLDVPDMPGMTVNATYACECYDGTPASCGTEPDSCSDDGNFVYAVTVNTTATYTPIVSYPGIPSSFTLKGQSIMRAAY